MAIDSWKKDLVMLFLQEVWNEGRIDRADQYIAPRYTVHHDPGDPWEGQELQLEAFKHRVKVSREPFPDQRFEVIEVFLQGNAVVVTWQWSGTHTGDMPGYPASGNRATTSGVTVYYFEGERIAGHWQVVDRLGVLRQIQVSR